MKFAYPTKIEQKAKFVYKELGEIADESEIGYTGIVVIK